MKELGFSLRDARDFALIGCQEITGSGNDYAAGNGTTPPEAYTQYSMILDMALNDGCNPHNNAQCSMHTGYLYEMESLDEVKEAWKKIARYVLRAQVTLENYIEHLFMYHDTHPILSISMEGCMERGVDVVCGGAKYCAPPANCTMPTWQTGRTTRSFASGYSARCHTTATPTPMPTSR